MNCDHTPLEEIGQKERRDKWFSGVESIDCPECNTTFELQRDYDGTMLLVKEDIA